eukprot:m.6185 g.6185  ORF g.6185 m.6185 type:complete len:77 (-) comp3807_c0_seq1:1754-1984(-)
MPKCWINESFSSYGASGSVLRATQSVWLTWSGRWCAMSRVPQEWLLDHSVVSSLSPLLLLVAQWSAAEAPSQQACP